MLDLINPPAIRSLTAEESERLKTKHPDLPSTPEECPTCKGTKKFTWWDDPASVDRITVEYECPCVEQWVLHRFFLNAGVDKAYQQLGWADMSWCEPGAIAEAQGYLDREAQYVANGFGIIFYGGKGTGKTALATLMLKSLLAASHDGFFTTFNAMLETFTAGWHEPEEKEWFHRRIKNAGVLVIDDPGKEMKGRIALPEALLDEVIRHRTAGLRPTFITTNSDMKVFAERYGEYVMSLLHERAMTYRFTGTDARENYRLRMHDEIDAGLTRPLVIR